MLAAAYEDELKAILAEVQAAEAKCRALVAEYDAWQIAQEQRDRVLEEAARLRDELDGLDFHGRRSLLLRIRAKIKVFSERDANPRWCVTTGFAVGRHISLSINKPVDLDMIAVGGSSGHMKSGTVLVLEDFEVDRIGIDVGEGEPSNLYSPFSLATVPRSTGPESISGES